MLFPVVRREETKTNPEEFNEERFLLFDGTTRLGELLVVVVRFHDSEWTIQQRFIRFPWVEKSVKLRE